MMDNVTEYRSVEGERLSTEPLSTHNEHHPEGLTSLPLSIRRLLTAIVLVAISAELGYVIINFSAMPVFVRSIGLPDQWIAIMGFAFLLMEGLLKSPFGALGDRVGRKVMIMTGPCVTVFTTLLTPHIHNPYILLTLRVLDGMGAAALWPACFSLIGDHVPEDRRATAMNFFNLAYLTGVSLGPLIGGGVNDFAFHHLNIADVAQRSIVSKEASFYVACGLFLLTALSAGILLPGGRPRATQHAATGEGGFNLQDFKRMLASIPMTLLITFTIFLGVGLAMFYVKVFTIDSFFKHTPDAESKFGQLLLAPSLVIAILSLKLGTLGDRYGKALAVKLGLGLCAGGFWLLLIFFNKTMLILLGSVIGLGFVIAFPAWMALVTSTCDESQRGAAVGAVGTAQGLGAIIGGGISGFLYKRPGFQLGPISVPAHGLPFLGCGVMLLIAFALALFTVRDTDHCELPA
jgi:DHA1 family multidrug resistance protein-like MFS transporter